MVLDTESRDFANYRRLNSEATRISSFGDISTVSGSRIVSPLEKLHSTAYLSLNDMNEAIINWMEARHGVDEFVEAQREFQNLTGKVFHDDFFYHQRMSYFLDYFTFQRPIEGSLRESDRAVTPYVAFLRSECYQKLIASRPELQLMEQLGNFRHSLWHVLRSSKSRVVLRDLFSHKKYELGGLNNILYLGFSAGVVLQGFLFELESGPQLSTGVLIHPGLVSRIICKAVKSDKKKPGFFDEMQSLTRLAKQNLALVRHRHLDPKKIYQQDPR